MKPRRKQLPSDAGGAAFPYQPKTKMLILPYPNNPTGGVMRRQDLEKVAEIVRERNLFVLSDEIYGELTYGGEPHVSFAEVRT